MQYKYCPLCTSELTDQTIDGEPRLACSSETCSFVHFNNPTPVVAAIVEYEGNIILGRAPAWPEGMFGLITGFLEAGETAEEGIVREIEEELGLQTTDLNFIGNYSFHQANQILICFHAEAEGLILRSDELAEIKKVPPAELQPWRFGTGPAVADWLASKGFG